MPILGWILLGLIAGFIGSTIVNKQGEGLLLDIALGVVGALVGGSIFSKLGLNGKAGFSLYCMFVAVVGAVVVLLLFHTLFRTGGPRPPPTSDANQ